MPHVGVERFCPRYRQHDRTQEDKSAPRMADQEPCPPFGVDGQEKVGMIRQLVQSSGGERQEPNQHDRTEVASDCMGTSLLHGEETDEQKNRDRKYEGLQPWRCDLQAL